MKDVAGKVAFVTGGDSGIGLGIARALLGAGMKVVITYRTRPHLEQALQSLQSYEDRLHTICLDVTDRSAMAAAATETIGVFGAVHVLINNAGISMPTPLVSATFDDFDWCVNVNIRGVFNGVKTFLPHIRAHGEGGHIVATSSMVGGVIVGPFWGVYSTSKFAVSGMMEALRSELIGTDIGVSVFCPSAVSTNIGNSARNRPTELPAAGTPDARLATAISTYRESVQRIVDDHPGLQYALDPLHAGECVLRGIRNDDLYIFANPEYEQAIQDRNDMLLASLPGNDATPSPARQAFSQLLRNPIYPDAIHRRQSSAP